jgi:hypothetical protein
MDGRKEKEEEEEESNVILGSSHSRNRYKTEAAAID